MATTMERVDANDKGHSYWVEFDQNYFAEGACRYAFKGKYHGVGPRDNDICVTKVFKEKYAIHYAEIIPDLAASKKVLEFALRFNSKNLSCEKIEVVIPLIAKMQNLSAFKLFWLFRILEDSSYVKAYEYISIEPFLTGNYTKFNSNGGYEDASETLMTAFSHWTWSASGHRFMACDLQGIKRGNTYILTDPAIHSADQIYGLTALGTMGMEKVLANHTCNSICRRLNLVNPLKEVFIPSRGMYTTYSFQITEEKDLQKMKKKKSQYFVLSPVAELH